MLHVPPPVEENSWIGAMGKMLGVVLLILAFLFFVSWVGTVLNSRQATNLGSTNPGIETSTPLTVETMTPTVEPTATPTPIPTATPIVSNIFSPLFFCMDDGFSMVSNKCVKSRRAFSGMVEKVYVSWSPSEAYRGATFTRVWTIDDLFIVESSSTEQYAHLEIAKRPSLKPGKYRVDLYVGETLVQSGSFTIE